METFDLWEKQVPGAVEGWEIPVIRYYPSENKTHRGTVIIFAGGAYVGRAEHEGPGYAVFLNAAGWNAFVVDYRVNPYVYPMALLDARRAVRFVRTNAERFGIDPEKIAVMGSSAGGNLCTMLCSDIGPFPEEIGDEIDSADPMPNAQILCYPYIFMADPELGVEWCSKLLFGEKNLYLSQTVSPELHITERTPQTFLFHTVADTVVNVNHSCKYVSLLQKKGIPVELHVFPDGKHGMGLCIGDDAVCRHNAQWGELLVKWLEYRGF